jgi:hypothetical protein
MIVTQKHAKFYYNILRIVCYTKRKLIKFVDLKVYIISSRCLSFFCSPKYKVIKYDFFAYLWDIFFTTSKYLYFKINQKYEFWLKTQSLVPSGHQIFTLTINISVFHGTIFFTYWFFQICVLFYYTYGRILVEILILFVH